jgi:hypothetical protein
MKQAGIYVNDVFCGILTEDEMRSREQVIDLFEINDLSLISRF